MKKLLKRLFYTAALTGAGVLALASCSGNSDGKIVITAGTKAAPAPFQYEVESAEEAVYTTKEGVHLAGYDIAVITEVFKLPEFENYTLDLSVSSNVLVDTAQGTIDFAINNYSYNTERAESYYFSYPYTKSRYTITSALGTSIDSFEELADSGLKIYGSAGGNTTNAIERWNATRTAAQSKINLEYSSVDITVQIEEAIAGQTALIHDQPVILKYKQTYASQFEQLNIAVLSDTETATNITANNTSHILFGKAGAKSKEYQQLISEGIKKLYDNGKLAELGQKWIAEALGDQTVSVLPLASDYVYLN